MKPIGYLFNGRFYKNLHDLRGKTMSEGNEPTSLYSESQMNQLREELNDCVKILHSRDEQIKDLTK